MYSRDKNHETYRAHQILVITSDLDVPGYSPKLVARTPSTFVSNRADASRSARRRREAQPTARAFAARPSHRRTAKTPAHTTERHFPSLSPASRRPRSSRNSRARTTPAPPRAPSRTRPRTPASARSPDTARTPRRRPRPNTRSAPAPRSPSPPPPARADTASTTRTPNSAPRAPTRTTSPPPAPTRASTALPPRASAATNYVASDAPRAFAAPTSRASRASRPRVPTSRGRHFLPRDPPPRDARDASSSRRPAPRGMNNSDASFARALERERCARSTTERTECRTVPDASTGEPRRACRRERVAWRQCPGRCVDASRARVRTRERGGGARDGGLTRAVSSAPRRAGRRRRSNA